MCSLFSVKKTRVCNDTVFGSYAVCMYKSNIDSFNNATLPYGPGCKYVKVSEELPTNLSVRKCLVLEYMSFKNTSPNYLS